MMKSVLCENKSTGCMKWISKAAGSLHIYGYVCGRLYAAGKDRCKGAIDEKQLAVLMRYLYAQASESFLYELYEVNIYQGNRYLFDSYFDFTRGTIKFNSVEASFTMEDIVIEN